LTPLAYTPRRLDEETAMKRASYRMFSSYTKSWETLFDEVARFLSELGRERVISVSHSADSGQGVVAVWFWETSA
jgi:hypothetical protein